MNDIIRQTQPAFASFPLRSAQPLAGPLGESFLSLSLSHNHPNNQPSCLLLLTAHYGFQVRRGPARILQFSHKSPAVSDPDSVLRTYSPRPRRLPGGSPSSAKARWFGGLMSRPFHVAATVSRTARFFPLPLFLLFSFHRRRWTQQSCRPASAAPPPLPPCLIYTVWLIATVPRMIR